MAVCIWALIGVQEKPLMFGDSQSLAGASLGVSEHDRNQRHHEFPVFST
jgi:hypothetical protein